MSEEYPQLTVIFVAQGLIRFRSMVQLIVGSAACRLSHSTSETLPQHSKATAGTDEAFPGIGYLCWILSICRAEGTAEMPVWDKEYEQQAIKTISRDKVEAFGDCTRFFVWYF